MERERQPEERAPRTAGDGPDGTAAARPLPGNLLTAVRDTIRQALSNDPEQFEKSVTQLSAQ